jgi:hypothetical protein
MRLHGSRLRRLAPVIGGRSFLAEIPKVPPSVEREVPPAKALDDPWSLNPMVGATGIEPVTPTSVALAATRLFYHGFSPIARLTAQLAPSRRMTRARWSADTVA